MDAILDAELHESFRLLHEFNDIRSTAMYLLNVSRNDGIISARVSLSDVVNHAAELPPPAGPQRDTNDQSDDASSQDSDSQFDEDIEDAMARHHAARLRNVEHVLIQRWRLPVDGIARVSDVNERGFAHGISFFQLVCLRGHTDLVRQCVEERGADVGRLTPGGHSCLDLARYHAPVLDYLQQLTCPRLRSPLEVSPLEHTDPEARDACAVCLEDVRMEDMRYFPARLCHFVCKTCIRRCLARDSRCAMCRQ